MKPKTRDANARMHESQARRLTVVAACRRIVCRNCDDCTFYLMTSTKPVMLDGNRAVKLAPHGSYYPTLEDDLRGTGLHGATNCWDSPLNVHLRKDVDRGQQQDDSHATITPPEDYLEFAIPFPECLAKTDIECGLPVEYAVAADAKRSAVTQLRQSIRGAGTVSCCTLGVMRGAGTVSCCTLGVMCSMCVAYTPAACVACV